MTFNEKYLLSLYKINWICSSDTKLYEVSKIEIPNSDIDGALRTTRSIKLINLSRFLQFNPTHKIILYPERKNTRHASFIPTVC